MDAHEITDIDKLLDALELQQDNDEKSLINQENIVPKRLASEDYSIDSPVSSKESEPTTNTRHKPNFINVTNVFNSLHEYVGIDINSKSAIDEIVTNHNESEDLMEANFFKKDVSDSIEDPPTSTHESDVEDLNFKYNQEEILENRDEADLENLSNVDVIDVTINDVKQTDEVRLEDDSTKDKIVDYLNDSNDNTNNNYILESDNINDKNVNPQDSDDKAIKTTLYQNNVSHTSTATSIGETITEVISFKTVVDDNSDDELEYLQDLEETENSKIVLSNCPVRTKVVKEEFIKDETNDEDDRLSQASTLEINETVKSDCEFDLPAYLDTRATVSQTSDSTDISNVAKLDNSEPSTLSAIYEDAVANASSTEENNPKNINNSSSQLMRPVSLDLSNAQNLAHLVASSGSTPLVEKGMKNTALLSGNDENGEIVASSTTTSTTSSSTSSLSEFGIQGDLNHITDSNVSESTTELYKEKLDDRAGEQPVNSSIASDITSTSSSSSTSSIHETPASNEMLATESASPGMTVNQQLGRVQPYWVPDNSTNNCMQCNLKFSILRRRHHCRCCGQLLCSSCCCLKAKLEYTNSNVEVRICIQCDDTLSKFEHENMSINNMIDQNSNQGTNDTNPHGVGPSNSPNSTGKNTSHKQPNPNNPMEYCSQISPLEQQQQQLPIAVMVPIGVLKRDGVPSKPSRKDKAVIFSDGIRPGCDLTELDECWGGSSHEVTSSLSKNKKSQIRRVQTPPGDQKSSVLTNVSLQNNKTPQIDEITKCYIDRKPNTLPPIYVQENLTEYKYVDVANDTALFERLKNSVLKFSIQRNFYVFCKIVKLTCCVNKLVINFTTHGMQHVGQDEIIILLEINEPSTETATDAASGNNKEANNKNLNLIPKDIFLHLNQIYMEADKGNIITDLGFSVPKEATFLNSKEHGGFLYIRPTFQCMQNIQIPESPYLIGVLIHRWELPWAKIFPLRLMLRLGALYRYYPSPHISVCFRDSVYTEIAQTIINFLADFRTYSYTITTVRGMYIHMEDRRTNVLIPRNRYDQVIKTLNNSSDHILALGGNFSQKADGHLVCIQNTESGCSEMHSYTTQAINIQGQPRKVTGASFLVLNGALKSTSGLLGKCSIVEDGLMVQILPAKMLSIRDSLKNMLDIEIICGPIDANECQTEKIIIKWIENDLNFNIGVTSPIDKKKMDGITSMRVHKGFDYTNANHLIRWTEVFIIQSDEVSVHVRDPMDVSKLSEQIARSTCVALVSFLDLLAANNLMRIGLRITLDPENVGFEAGSQYNKLAPIYMNALDNQLIKILHEQMTSLQINQIIILELIFHILDK